MNANEIMITRTNNGWRVVEGPFRQDAYVSSDREWVFSTHGQLSRWLKENFAIKEKKDA